MKIAETEVSPVDVAVLIVGGGGIITYASS